MSSARYKAYIRRFQIAARNVIDRYMSLDMIDCNEGKRERICESLRVRNSDKQRSQKSRSLRHGDSVYIFKTFTAPQKRFLHNVRYSERMIPRRYLGNHSAVSLVYIYLRSDNVRKRLSVVEDRRRRFVARRLYGEYQYMFFVLEFADLLIGNSFIVHFYAFLR